MRCTKDNELTHSRLDDVIGTSRPPLNGSGFALGEDGNGLAVNDKFAILGLDGSLEATVDGVKLEHVDLWKTWALLLLLTKEFQHVPCIRGE